MTQQSARPPRTVSLPDLPQGPMNTSTPLLQHVDQTDTGRDPQEDEEAMPSLGGTRTPVSITSLAVFITL